MPDTSALDTPVHLVNDDLDALRILLCLVARGDPPARENAVIYATCRGRLLASFQGRMLPGFLYQCATIDRFRDFIHLYDPEIDLRLHFIDRMIDRARPAADPQKFGQSLKSTASSWDF